TTPSTQFINSWLTKSAHSPHRPVRAFFPVSTPDYSRRFLSAVGTPSRGDLPVTKASQPPARDTTASDNTTPYFFDRRGLAEKLGTSLRSLDRLDAARKLPPSLRIGTMKRWLRSEIAAWIGLGCPCQRKFIALRRGRR